MVHEVQVPVQPDPIVALVPENVMPGSGLELAAIDTGVPAVIVDATGNVKVHFKINEPPVAVLVVNVLPLSIAVNAMFDVP